MTESKLRNFVSSLLLLVGIGTLGFAAYAFYTEVRYPLGALKVAEVQSLKVELGSSTKGPVLHVTGTIGDSALVVRKVSSLHVGSAMWLKIYPVAEQQVAPTKIDMRVPLRTGTTELRFGPDKEVIWRSSIIE